MDRTTQQDARPPVVWLGLVNLFFASFGFMLLRFVLGPIRIKLLTTFLSKEQYGTLSLIMLTISFITLVSSIGSLDFLLLRLPGQARSYQNGMLKTVMKYFGGMSLVIGVAGAAILMLGASGSMHLTALDAVACGILLVLYVHLNHRSFYLLGKTEYSRSRVIQLSYADLWFLPLLFFAWWGTLSTSLVLWLWIVWYLLTAMATSRWVPLSEVWKEEAGRARLAEVLRFGVPLIPMILGDWLMRLQDRYVLLAFADIGAVANYMLCMNLAMIGVAMGDAALDILLTQFFRIRNQVPGGGIAELSAHPGLQRYFAAMIRYSMVIAIALGAAMIFMPSEIILFLSSRQFLDAAHILPWAAPFPAMFLFTIIFGRTLIALNRSRLLGWATLGAAVANIALNFLLIPWLGAVGCALAATLSMGALAAFLGLSIRCWRWVDWKELAGARLIAFLLLCGAGFWAMDRWLSLRTLLTLVSGAAWCLVCAVVLRLVRKEDLALVSPAAAPVDPQVRSADEEREVV